MHLLNVCNSIRFDEIISYVDAQFDCILAEESRIKRNTKSIDSRVHAVLYFIEPTGHALREMDVEFIKRLGSKANVIPIISKADSLTSKELKKYKKMILEETTSITIF